MTIPGRAHVVSLGQGRTVDLGVAQMRVLASGEATNGGAFTFAEFSGTGEGAWTVPHLPVSYTHLTLPTTPYV